MVAYQVRLALRSLRRNPVLSALLVGGIGLGIMVSMVFVTIYYHLAGNPIPDKSDRLFYVQMDSWNPDDPWDDDDPTEPPNQLTYIDALAVKASTIPTHSCISFKANLTIHPDAEGLRPYREDVRMTSGDFFPMFEVPFRYGGGWDAAADRGPEPVVVLDAETNQKLFGGADSVGRTLRIEETDFRVVGVMAHWRPMPKYYDTHNDPVSEPEHIYIPFNYVREMQVYSSGNSSNWKPVTGGYDAYLQSETIWIQGWVQLDDATQRAAFMDYLNAYVMDQKKLGRFGRPLNNRLRNVMEWLRFEKVVPDEVVALVLISLLFLLVCSVNLIGILLGKFLARAPEVGVRRALGASRRQIFLHHLVECEVIGIAGGIIGLGLTFLGIRWVDSLFTQTFEFSIDWTLFVVALGLSSVAAMISGVYPAWRICRIEPAVHLKAQ